MIAGNERQDVRDRMYEEILPYITRIYRRYADRLESDIRNRNQEFEGHGFLLGFLANFSHLHTIDIDPDLSTENSCVVFLVHRQEERENIPIVINVIGWRTPSGAALNRARGNAKRLRTSSFIPVHTESGYAVCVGLNFNLNLDPFSVDTVELQQDRFPLVEKLFERVRNRQDRQIQEETRNFLLHHLPREIPIDEGNRDRRFDYMTGFAFGSSAFDIHPVRLEEDDEAYVTKYIFRYNNQNLRRSVLTMVLHAQDSDVVILHIRASNDIQLEAIRLPQDNIAAVGVVTYTLNDRSGINSNAVRFNTPEDYLLGNRGDLLGDQLVEIPNAENVHGILEGVMNDDWQDGAQHGELLTAISRVLMPEDMNGNAIIDVDSEDKFRSILHGVFYVYDSPDKVLSRYKISQTYGPERIREGVVEEVRTRVTEQRLDLLSLRRPTGNDSDTHPIGYVLGFAGSEQEVQQEQEEAEQRINELMEKERGYLPVTSGNEVVFCPVVLNVAAQRAEELITIPENLYIHEINRHYGPRRAARNQEQVLQLINAYIQNNPNGNFDQLENVHDILTLDFATDNLNYHYWLQHRDVFDAARRYGFNVENDQLFAITSEAQITEPERRDDDGQVVRQEYQWVRENLQRLRGGENGERRILTLIVNLGNVHWVTLTIVYQNENYYCYYANSTGGGIPNDVRLALEDSGINNANIHNILADQQGNLSVQQRDNHNCGLWALENARDINQVLQGNNNLGERGLGMLDEMRRRLTLNVPGLNNQDNQNHPRNEQYFQDLRREISREFRNTGTNAGQSRDNDPLIRGTIRLQNQNGIRELLLEYLELTLSHVQSLHFDKEQQVALLQFVSSSFPNASIELAKQGLYLPSFEKRGVNVNGKCVATTRGLSQALSLHENKSLLNNLKTSSEIYERIAQGKQISKREEKEAFTFSKLLSIALFTIIRTDHNMLLLYHSHKHISYPIR
ncbi:hypothetical protein, partial [Wolbachia endosymbiont of Drosophila bicornuta]